MKNSRKVDWRRAAPGKLPVGQRGSERKFRSAGPKILAVQGRMP